jgi:eukaryotic-like serine/threonine-protein kinase
MNDDTDRDIAVFTEAIRIPPRDRASFLEEACGGDKDLRRKVEALLSANDRMGSFLEEPPTGGPIE